MLKDSRFILAAVSTVFAGALGANAVPAHAQTVKIDGSSTVFPITEAIAEDFQKAKKGKIRVTVGISGTGGGFKKFCRGETDISDASRPILKKEMDECKKSGIQYIELPVAYDALTVVIHPENKWAQTLTVAELKKMWEPPPRQSHQMEAGHPGFPDAPLKLFGAAPIPERSTISPRRSTASPSQSAATSQHRKTTTAGAGVSRDVNALGFSGWPTT